MTDPMTLDELKARRDAARERFQSDLRDFIVSLVHSENGDLTGWTEGDEDFIVGKAYDLTAALEKLEGDVRVAEACEALKEESRNRHPYGDERHQRWLDVADFLRARLTPEETGR